MHEQFLLICKIITKLNMLMLKCPFCRLWSNKAHAFDLWYCLNVILICTHDVNEKLITFYIKKYASKYTHMHTLCKPIILAED